MKDEVINFLNNNKDEKYSSFSSNLIKDNLRIVGVKLPLLYSFAKSQNHNLDEILSIEDDCIFEIRMIKLYVISQIKDVNKYKEYFKIAIDLITNWSLCDSFIMHSKIIRQDKKYFLNEAKKLIKSNSEYYKRIGFIILLSYYIDDDYVDEVFTIIKDCKTCGYYSEMALSWLISELYVIYTNKAKEYLLTTRIDKIVIKYAIRKIKDSYRVSTEDKVWLKKIEC